MTRALAVSTVLAGLLASMLPSSASAQTSARQRVNVAALGPQVGQQVPDFTLADQNGTRRTLQSILGPRGALIVFVRSADWCPFCRTQLVELQGRVEELKKQGLGLVAISYDSVPTLAAFSTRNGITYPLLSDVGSATIRRYGILNTIAEEALGANGKDPALLADLRVYATAGEVTERLRGIPFPGTFVVDRQGRVTSRFFDDYYWERTTTANILMRAGAGVAPIHATQASTQHLDLKSYPSDGAVSLGTKFSLAADITPKKGMHVYAPGAKNYRVITLNIEPQAHLRITPVRYPASEIYHFVPLNERVPTYQKPFTIALDVVAEGTPEGRKAFAGRNELVITGTLEYQACDDKICYNPVSLPLSWKVELKPNVAGAPAPPPATR